MKMNFIIFAAALAAGAAIGLVCARGTQNGILKTMDARESTRSFSTRPLDDKTTDEILWAAFGKNGRGTRTIPTARNQQDLKVFAIRADGAFFYDGEKLNKVSDKDLRPLFASQPYVMDAPLTLVFAGADKRFAPMHAGSSYQNVALYCAENGIGNVVRGYFDAQGVERELNLPKGEFAIISQTIGYKK
jgi:nitroreductase